MEASWGLLGALGGLSEAFGGSWKLLGCSRKRFRMLLFLTFFHSLSPHYNYRPSSVILPNLSPHLSAQLSLLISNHSHHLLISLSLSLALFLFLALPLSLSLSRSCLISLLISLPISSLSYVLISSSDSSSLAVSLSSALTSSRSSSPLSFIWFS